MSQVDFSTRFVFLIAVFYCTLGLSEVVFFSALVRHQKHHISVIFNITPNMYTFLESWKSWLVLKPQKWPAFSRKGR